MSNKYFIQVVDRLIYSGLSLEEAIDLLSHFIAENKMFEEKYKSDKSSKLSWMTFKNLINIFVQNAIK